MGGLKQPTIGRKIVWDGKPIFPGFDSLTYSDDEKVAARSQEYYRDRSPSMLPRNQVQLCAYPDGIGGNLRNLKKFLDESMKGVFGGIYLMPSHPSNADRGFAPVTYTELDPKFGSWEDIEDFTQDYDLCLDFMPNHISTESKEFRDFLAKGDGSEYKDMFLHWDKVWPEGWEFVEASIRSLATRGLQMLRLDAFGYCFKKAGSKCYFEVPETTELLRKIEGLLQESGARILCEVHLDHRYNADLAEKGYWGYNFALPLLVQHALHYQTAVNLRRWLQTCPRRQVTVLETHDGVGVDDLVGLLDEGEVEEFRRLARIWLEQDRMTSTNRYVYDPKTSSFIENIHDINSAYYPLCQEDDLTYLLARAIQLFFPGIPLVFYVGALAGSNDIERVKKGGDAQEIGRRNFTMEEAREQVAQPVVQALIALCRFRNQHPAFQGTVALLDDESAENLKIRWEKSMAHATLTANLTLRTFNIAYTPATPNGEDQLKCVRFDKNGISSC